MARNEDDICCVSGSWGTGKTHAWKTAIQQHSTKNPVRQDKLSYISLFGVDSLDALKRSVFEEVVDVYEKPNSSPLSKIIPVTWRKHARHAVNVPVLGKYAEAFTPFYFSTVSNAIICFDDIERRDKNLSLRAIFGLAVFLRDMRNCRIIFLLNPEDLSKEKNDFKKYFEKTFDGAIRLEPTVTDCCQIAFGSEEKYRLLSEYARQLPINNIRILKKIRRFFDAMLPHMKDLMEPVQQQVAQSCVLLTWSKFGDDAAPDFQFVIQMGSYVSSSEREGWSDDEKSHAGLIEGYGYRVTDALDSIIADYISTGHLDMEAFQKAAIFKHDEMTSTEAEIGYSMTWDLFHDSLNDNEEEVVDALTGSFRKNQILLGCNRLNELCRLLRDLGREDDIRSLVGDYSDARSNEEPEFWDTATYHGFDIKWDPELKMIMDQRFAEHEEPLDALRLLAAIGGENASPTNAVDKLGSISEDELYQVFKSTSPDNHRSVIRGALYFSNITNATTEQREFVDKSKNALSKIASESKINQRRLANWGIYPSKVDGD